MVVVGAGHLSGVENYLKNSKPTESLVELEHIPKKSLVAKSIPWLIPLLVFGLFGFFVYSGSGVDLVELFTVWTLANALFAAIGCIIARGHILAILLRYLSGLFS